MKRNRSLDKTLLVLLGGALLIKLVFAIPVFIDSSRALACTDAFFYDRIAHNLLEGNGFSMDETPPYRPDSTVAPGYPFFVAALYALFGGSKVAVVMIQIILNLVLLYVLYRFLKKRFGDRPALLFGIIFAVDVNFSIFVNQITSETLFTALFIPGLLFILTASEEKVLFHALWAGLLLGAATLVRPLILYFGVPLILFLLLTRINCRKLLQWGMIVGLQLVFIAPWVMRNRAVFGEICYTTVSNINLMRYHAVPLYAFLEHKSRAQSQVELEEAALGGEVYENEVQRLNAVGSQARRYLLKHPLPYAGAAIVGGLGSLIYPLPLHETGVYLKGQMLPPAGSIMVDLLDSLSRGRIGEAIRMAWQERLSYYGTLTVVVFLLYGLFHLAKLAFGLRAFILRGLKDPLMLLFFLTGVYFLGLLGLAVVPRMRVPVEPLLLSLAAIGVFAKKKSKDKRTGKDGK